MINITYLILMLVYFLITNNSNYLLNSELIFGSIFVSALPEYSPVNNKKILVYSILIGILVFIITITFI